MIRDEAMARDRLARRIAAIVAPVRTGAEREKRAIEHRNAANPRESQGSTLFEDLLIAWCDAAVAR